MQDCGLEVEEDVQGVKQRSKNSLHYKLLCYHNNQMVKNLLWLMSLNQEDQQQAVCWFCQWDIQNQTMFCLLLRWSKCVSKKLKLSLIEAYGCKLCKKRKILYRKIILELVKLPEWKKVLGPQLKDRGPGKTCEIQGQIGYQKISTEERNRIRGNFFIGSEDDLNSSHT